MEYLFKTLTSEELENLILEAEKGKAFLPSKEKPEETILPLMNKFGKKGYFKIYGFANKQGEVMSFISIFEGDNSIDIGPMYVGKDFRGMGFGIKQVENIIQMYSEKGVKEMQTQTWGENQASQSIMLKQKFELIETIPDSRVNGDSTVKFKLEL